MLVIDDDTEIQGLLREVLTGTGFLVAVAGTGEAGVQEALALAPDVVLLDIVLPDVPGNEVLARLQADSEHVPVIAISGRTAREDLAGLLLAGARDFVAKPFDVPELTARVVAAVRDKRRADRLRVSHERLVAVVTLDPETGLPHRQAAVAALHAAAERAAGRPLAVLAFEVAGGEPSVPAVAEILDHRVRAGDQLVRWDRETLVVIAPGATEDEARGLHARLAHGIGIQSAGTLDVRSGWSLHRDGEALEALVDRVLT